MSFLLPRRTKDLPALDTDSDDDFKTPRRDKSNKENETQLENATVNNAVTNLLLPKRVSELALEDSDDEQNLNSAFVISPSKSDQDEEGNISPGFSKNNTYNELLQDELNNVRSSGTETGTFLTTSNCPVPPQPLIFENVKAAGIKNVEKSSQNLSILLAPSDVSKSLLTSSHPESNTKNRIIVNTEKPTIASTAKIIKANEAHCIPQTFGETAASVPKNYVPVAGDIQTPFKPCEEQFATPQLRSWSFARKTRDLCSSQSQRSRNAFLNECRTQKVLFQTPMTVSRAPILHSQNDSITVSLWDSIHDGNTTSEPKEKQPLANVPEVLQSSKKHFVESVFSSNEKEMKACEEQKSLLPSFHCSSGNQDKRCAPISLASTSKTTAESDKIIVINGIQYLIRKKLGSGGSSSVYLTQRKDTEEECALKIVDLRGDPAVIEGYLNETKLLAKLQGNITVVSLYDYELLRKESKLYMVMEKGDSDLHKILQTYNSHIPLYVLMSYWYQMLQAVDYIHQNGVIHSDLKPANFLMVNGRLKLIDFGIASNISMDSTSIIKFSQAGTFNYISPEALTDTSTGNSPARNMPKIKISTKSDVWSLGCILYLFLYKRTPFGNIKNIYAKISAISNPKTEIEYQNIPSFYPIMLLDMAKICLQYNPKMRPSVAELLRYPFQMVIPLHNLRLPQK